MSKSPRTLNTTFSSIEQVEAHNAKVRAARDKKAGKLHYDGRVDYAHVFSVAKAAPKVKPQRRAYAQSVKIVIPGLKIISEANNRDHFAVANKRHAAHKFEAETVCYQFFPRTKFEFPVVVRLTRVGPKALDDDNLANGFKAVRDGIAAALGVDDGDVAKIRFEYDQYAVRKHAYEVWIEVRTV